MYLFCILLLQTVANETLMTFVLKPNEKVVPLLIQFVDITDTDWCITACICIGYPWCTSKAYQNNVVIKISNNNSNNVMTFYFAAFSLWQSYYYKFLYIHRHHFYIEMKGKTLNHMWISLENSDVKRTHTALWNIYIHIKPVDASASCFTMSPVTAVFIMPKHTG